MINLLSINVIFFDFNCSFNSGKSDQFFKLISYLKHNFEYSFLSNLPPNKYIKFLDKIKSNFNKGNVIFGKISISFLNILNLLK